MVYFFHHYEIPAIVNHGAVRVTATVNIYDHQRAPARRPSQDQPRAPVGGVTAEPSHSSTSQSSENSNTSDDPLTSSPHVSEL